MLRRILHAGGVIGVIAVLGLCMSLGGLALEYDIEFWTSYAKGAQTDVPFWACFLVGLLPPVASLAIFVAILTWVVSFAL